MALDLGFSTKQVRAPRGEDALRSLATACALAKPSRRGRWLLGFRVICLFSICVMASAPARADVYVYPRRASKTNVHYANFAWKFIDIRVNKGRPLALSYGQGARLHSGALQPPAAGTWAWPSVHSAPTSAFHQTSGPLTTALPTHSTSPHDSGDHAGGVRLYFYERERPIAQRASASIEASYDYLAREFDYKPQATFAYFLYASYIEFLQTDLFPLQEGVLGVTSPENLDVTLPYFGDARLFSDVSTHELAHEFTIQKVATAAKKLKLSGDPLSGVPLWFVEGLAEFYAKRGIDPETDMLVRDILTNPKTDHDYVFSSFWEDRFTSGLWTYKVGQARCAFLEEAFGKGTIQRILEAMPGMLIDEDKGGFRDFPHLVSKVTGASQSAIAARFERWVKRRAFQTFLNARQDRANFTTLHNTDGIVQALRAAPSGELVMYRSIEADTGQSRLFMFDRRAPKDDIRVAADDEPGAESLHPVAGQNFDLTDHELAFVAQVGGADTIYLQGFVEAALPHKCKAKAAAKKTCSYSIHLELSERRGFRVVEQGVDAVEAVALSADGKQIAFVGLSTQGQRDLYLLEPHPDGSYRLQNLTHDIYAEREVAFGPDGIVFSSDATGHGKYNLFKVDPRSKIITRLTREPRDELNPSVMRDGRVMFVAYDEHGANLYSVDADGMHKETDVATGLFDVNPGPDDTVWALHHTGADRAPVRIARKRLLHEDVHGLTDAADPTPPRERSLDGARDYDAFKLSNWELGSIFLMAGVSSTGSVIGQVLAGANDRLRDHGVIVSAAMYGDTALIDAAVTYVNEQRRLIWGAGIFNDIRSRIDRQFQVSDNLVFASWERYFGAEGLLRYPFSRFVYLQGSLSAGCTHYFLLSDTRDQLAMPNADMPDRNLLNPWRADNAGVRFQTEGQLSLGYNTIGVHRTTGPIRNSAFLLSTVLGTQPFNNMVYDQVRLDAEHYIRIFGPVNIFFRTGLGMTIGSQRAPQFYLSSFQTLRGVPFGDIDYLLGRQFAFATTELQFPIIELASFPLIDLEGVLGADVGAVADDYDPAGRRRPLDALWRKRLLDLVFGVNFGFGPIIILVHFGKPIDIGPIPVPNDGKLTFNLSLGWRYQ
jgi:hypothetical protein